MKYTRENIVREARIKGFSGQTNKGAIKFLNNNLPNSVFRNMRLWILQRGYDKEKYYKEQHERRYDSRINKRADKIAQKLGLWRLDDAETLANRINREQCLIISQQLSTITYRKSRSTRAGGNHSSHVEIGLPRCKGGSKRAWSRNGKWWGTNSYNYFYISPAVAFNPKIFVIGGLVTLDAKLVGTREYKAIWAEQSKGFKLKQVAGYIIRGFHVKADSFEKARKKAMFARTKTLSTRLKEREHKQNKRKELKMLSSIFVQLQDSLVFILEQINKRINHENSANDKTAV